MKLSYVEFTAIGHSSQNLWLKVVFFGKLCGKTEHPSVYAQPVNLEAPSVCGRGWDGVGGEGEALMTIQSL